MSLFADVIIDITAPSLDRSFQYAVPADLESRIRVGSMVSLPFGNRDAEKKGYVISLSRRPKIDPSRIKEIGAIVTDDSTVEPELVKLAAWMARNYGSTMAAALRVVFPVKRKIKSRTPEEEEVITDLPEVTLSAEQLAASEGVIRDFDAGEGGVSLIKGITGSGKTEVYIDIARQIVERGHQVIVLIPEIALTYQTVMRFKARFGDRVSTIHSRLSAGERYDRFAMAQRGEIDVMIGPRSALFTPFPKLGAIIIDEEHESSYKSEQTPKYHARETAIYRAAMCKAVVVLGSATPSVDSYYRAKKGRYRLYELNSRATGAQLAEVRIVDLRAELMRGNRSPISDELRESIEDRLKKKEQVMLFLNRRGYAGFVSCRNCGYVFKCPHCDVSRTIHTRDGKTRLVCHYCGYSEPFKKICPSCGSKFVGAMKAGTQAIETVVRQMFPAAKVSRMDWDTTRGKKGHEHILSDFAAGKTDILIGTQMIVKGHDFPKVTLVGILAADMSLFAPDYRAGERTFSLLTQAAGRAGRADKPGLVIIQTYNPENPYIISSADQDYESFYRQEMAFRSLLSYPPASHMLVALFEGKNEEEVSAAADRAGSFATDRARQLFEADKMLQVIGPAPAGISCIRDVYRYVLYLKCDDYGCLVEMKNRIEEMPLDRVGVQFDFDPVSGY